MLLLNWDIQRCAEKTEFDISNANNKPNVREDDMKFLIDRISKRLNDCLTYLPVTWDLKTIIDGICIDQIIMSQFNLKSNLDFVEALFNTVLKEIEKADQESNNQLEFISFIISPDFYSLKYTIDQLSFLSDSSTYIKKIIEKWNRLYEFCIQKSGESDSKRAKYLEENEEEFSRLFNDLKLYVRSVKFDTIKREIEKAF